MKTTHYIKITALLIILVMLFTNVAMAKNASEDAQGSQEYELLYLINELRISEGLYPVSRFSALDEAAKVRAEELGEVYSHRRPDGSDCFSVLDEFSIPYHTAAENIASGSRTARDVMDVWYESDGHRMSMLDGSFRHAGIGYESRGNYWAQIFVGGCSIKNVRVEAKDPDFGYSVGTSIKEIADSMNYRIVGECSMHGEFELPINAAMCSGYDSSLKGDQSITIICYGVTMRLTVTLTEGYSSYIMGDTNSNGELDAGDVTLLLRYVVGIIDERGLNMDVADFNGDGKVNTGDATAILRVLV